MSSPARLRVNAAELRALERIKAKLAARPFGHWVGREAFTNAEAALLEAVRYPEELGLEKRPLFPGSKAGDWRLARPKTYATRTADGRTVRVTVPGNEDARALEELCDAAVDARLVLMMAGGTARAAKMERERSIARLEAALRGMGINV